MLVLSRKMQQSIRIGDAVTVTILRVKGKTVRVGIEAPDDLKIVRGELPDYTLADDTPTATAAGSVTQPDAAGDQMASFAPAPVDDEDDDQMPLGFTDHPPMIGWESSESIVSRPR